MSVRVQTEDFDVGAEHAALLAGCAGAGCAKVGAVASFLGVVRSGADRPLVALTLEHYPAMTERAMAEIAGEAVAKFDLAGVRVVHRVGRLVPGANIVLVLAAAAHRQAALDGVGFLIDWLKTAAPFWKQEEFADGGREWLAARGEDEAAAQRW